MFSCILTYGSAAMLVSGLFPGGSLTAADQAKLPAIPAVKAWRGVTKPGGQEKTFNPVLKEQSIEFGSKTIQLFPDGKFTCITPEYSTLTVCNPPLLFPVKKGKPQYTWQAGHLDQSRSKFFRDGRKYCWELWYGDPEIKPFPAIRQTLEVMPDGKLRLTHSFSLPPKTPDLEFRTWVRTVNFNESNWDGETVSLPGKKITLSRKMKRCPGGTRDKELDCVFAWDTPAKKLTVRLPGLKRFLSMEIRYYPAIHCYQFFSDSTEIIFDFTRGVEPTRKRDIRGGVDLTAEENLTMPDNRHKNLIRNASFEGGLEGWFPHFFGHCRQWFWTPFELDETVAFDGKNSLKLNVIKMPDWNVINANIAPQLVIAEPGTYTVSFSVKGEKDGNSVLYAWLPSHTGGNYPTALHGNKAQWKFPVTAKWQRHSFTFTLKPAEKHLAVCFYGQAPSGKGTIWLDAVQLEKGPKATEFAPVPAEGRLITSDPENFISSKNRIDGRFRITTAKPEMSGTAHITVKNFFGEILLDLKNDFKTGKDRTAEFVLGLDDLPGLGVFVVKGEYRLADGSEAYDFRRYAKIEFQERPRPNKRVFAVDYRNTSVRNEFVTRLKRWRKLGVGSKHWAQSFLKKDWDMYEKYGVKPYVMSMISYVYKETTRGTGKGVAHFAIRDPEKEAGGHLKLNDPRVMIYDYHVEAGGKITPAYLEKLKNVAASIAKRYPFIHYWVLGGEVTCKLPNDWWGKGDKDQDVARKFALLLKAFSEGVHEGNPQAKVLQDCPANMSPDRGIAETGRLLAECNKLGVKFDVIGIHPYRFSPENPDLDSDTHEFLEVLRKNGYGDAKVLWNEGMFWGPYDIPQWGVSSSNVHDAPGCWRRGPMTYDMGWTEKRTAAWYARAWLVVLKYADTILGATSGQTINNCYMDLQQTPFAAQLMPNTLCCILGDAKFKKDIRFAPYMRAFVFEDAQKRPVAAVWCHHPDVDSGKNNAPVFAADFGDSLETVLDLMNSPRAFKTGRMEFPVSPFPLFFRGKPGTLDRMIRAFEQTEQISGSNIPPMGITANPCGRNHARITFKNQVSREFTGKFNGKELRIPASGQTSVDIPLDPPLNDRSIVHVKLPVTLETAAGMTWKQNFEFDAFPVRKVPDNASIDSLDWAALPSIPFVRMMGKPKSSGSFRAGWNPFGFFLEVTVKDAKFVHTEYPKPYDLWKNDCVQIYFDTFANARHRILHGYDKDDYEYALFPDSRGTSARVFRYRTADPQLALAMDAPQDETFAPDIPCRFSNKDGVLTYRVFFPAKYLLPMRLENGWVFGFSLFVDDSNEPGKVDGALTLTSDGKGCYKRPHAWPAAILVE